MQKFVLPFSLTTPQLALRDFTPLDFEALYATTNHPEYHRFYSEEEMTREQSKLYGVWKPRLLSGRAANVFLPRIV